MFDVAVDREGRREKQGYVTPGQARAFLQMSRELRLGSDSVAPDNPLARAYFRGIESTTTTEARAPQVPQASDRGRVQPAPEDSAEAVAAVFEVLHEAGILGEPTRALLPSGSEAHARAWAI
jgi:hypothetical protein